MINYNWANVNITMISNDYAPCLDIESIRLCVDEGNLKAKKFYESAHSQYPGNSLPGLQQAAGTRCH